MKAETTGLHLTVKNPMAWGIARGFKTVENRSWAPPDSIIGKRITIHAGAAYKSRHQWLEAMARTRPFVRGMPAEDSDAWRWGQLVCTVVIAGIVDAGDRASSQVDRVWHANGSIGWLLREPRILRPGSPMRGSLGLWRITG